MRNWKLIARPQGVFPNMLYLLRKVDSFAKRLRRSKRGTPTGPSILGISDIWVLIHVWLPTIKWPCVIYSLCRKSIKSLHIPPGVHPRWVIENWLPGFMRPSPRAVPTLQGWDYCSVPEAPQKKNANRTKHFLDLHGSPLVKNWLGGKLLKYHQIPLDWFLAGLVNGYNDGLILGAFPTSCVGLSSTAWVHCLVLEVLLNENANRT